MKKILMFYVLMVVALMASASTTWTLQGKVYNVDTLYHAKVGPGTTQTSLALSGDLDLRIFYTTTDLSNPNVEMRVAKAGNVIKKTATVTNLSKSNSKEGAQYFVGVNADFFDMSNGQPLGVNVLNSEIYNLSGDSNWTELSFDAFKTPRIGDLTFSGSVKKTDGTSYEVSTINSQRLENYLVVFSSRYGSSTGSNQWGVEVVAKPIEDKATIALGKSVKMKIVGSPETAGNMTIPSGAYVLSGHGTAKTFLGTLVDGDEIEVSLKASNASSESVNPVWAVGGCPVLLKDGVVQETEDKNIIDHLPNKEPRTAVGYDSTGTKVMMLVVDGRSEISDGCRTKILADIMREVGCSDAMNFDGGGSTELYHQKLGIRNRPSGGSERAVTNALFAVATVPTDTEIAEIRFVDWVKELPKYGYYTPKFYGYNKYGVLVNTDVDGVKLSCSAELGEIVNDGTTLFCNGGGTHALTATYKGISTTLAVSVDDKTEPIFRHPKVLLDSYKDYTVDIYGVIRGEEVKIDNTVFAWTSSDENVAIVDSNGVIKGLKNGTAVVRGTVGDYSKDIEVTVEIPTVHYQLLDDAINMSNWTVEVGTAISSYEVKPLGKEGFIVDYTIGGSGTKTINIKRDIKTWSRPDSILIDINPGESLLQAVYVYYEDQEGEEKRLRKGTSGLVANAVNRILLPISGVVDVEDMSLLPITFKRLCIQSKEAVGVKGHVEVLKMAMVYNSVPADASGVIENFQEKEVLILSPNPVKSGEVVNFGVSEPVKYSIYSLSGAVVAQGNGTEFATAGMSSGVYIVKVDGLGVARMIVKK